MNNNQKECQTRSDSHSPHISDPTICQPFASVNRSAGCSPAPVQQRLQSSLLALIHNLFLCVHQTEESAGQLATASSQMLKPPDMLCLPVQRSARSMEGASWVMIASTTSSPLQPERRSTTAGSPCERESTGGGFLTTCTSPSGHKPACISDNIACQKHHRLRSCHTAGCQAEITNASLPMPSDNSCADCSPRAGPCQQHCSTPAPTTAA